MTAIGLLKGGLVAEDYEDVVANDPLIDQLRDLMVIEEDERYSKEYHEPEKRSIANAVQIFFKDGTSSEKISVEFPIGHKRRREEGIPILEEKFRNSVRGKFSANQAAKIFDSCFDTENLLAMPVDKFVDLFVV